MNEFKFNNVTRGRIHSWLSGKLSDMRDVQCTNCKEYAVEDQRKEYFAIEKMVNELEDIINAE